MQIATPPELPYMALVEWSSPRAELTNTPMMVIAIMTVCATLPVVAAIKTVSCSASLYSNVLMVVVFALTVGYHSNHFIEIAFDTEALGHMDLGTGRPNFGKDVNPSCVGWLTLFCWGSWMRNAGPFFAGTFNSCISRGCTITQVGMHTLPSMYAALWFCIFGAASSGMNGRAAWFQNISATEFANADCYLHAGASARFWPSGAGRCFCVLATPSTSTKWWRAGQPWAHPR